MPFRFHKSLKILPGIRINFSKSGIGTSFGKAPYTYSIGPRGTRKTASIPGTGVSFVDQSRSGRKTSSGCCLTSIFGAIFTVIAALVTGFFNLLVWLTKLLVKISVEIYKFATATPQRSLASFSFVGLVLIFGLGTLSVNFVVNALKPTATPTFTLFQLLPRPARQYRLLL
jgi:hypothetical protein